MVKCWLVVIIFLLLCSTSFAVDRCLTYVKDIRRSDFRVHGIEFPYHYSVGVAIAESSCRPNITSFDGGKGLFQFTPSTGIVKEIEKDLDINFDPYSSSHSIMAFSYWVGKLFRNLDNDSVYFTKVKKTIYPKSFKKKCGAKLRYIYMMYNAGYWLVYEFEKGNSKYCDLDYIKQFCGRSGTYTPQGKWLSFCEINYDYPNKIKKYAEPYRVAKDSSKWKF